MRRIWQKLGQTIKYYRMLQGRRWAKDEVVKPGGDFCGTLENCWGEDGQKWSWTSLNCPRNLLGRRWAEEIGTQDTVRKMYIN